MEFKTTFLNIGLQFLARGLSISHEIRRISWNPYEIRRISWNPYEIRRISNYELLCDDQV